MTSLVQVQAAVKLIYGPGPATPNTYEAARALLNHAHQIGFRFGTKGAILGYPPIYITDFVFQDADFFVAHLSDRGVRIGMVGGQIFNIPAGRAWHERITECDDRLSAEAMFDELFEVMGVL